MACTNGNANAFEMCENNAVVFLQDELKKRSGVVHHCKMELLFCESLVFLLLTKMGHVLIVVHYISNF